MSLPLNQKTSPDSGASTYTHAPITLEFFNFVRTESKENTADNLVFQYMYMDEGG